MKYFKFMRQELSYSSMQKEKAFNTSNRKVMLRNISWNFIIATYINNCYCSPANLFIIGGWKILSKEGTRRSNSYSCLSLLLLTRAIDSMRTRCHTGKISYECDLSHGQNKTFLKFQEIYRIVHEQSFSRHF